MASEIIWAHYNGNVVALHDLKVPVTDRAYLFGDAIYEVIRVYHGKPFLLADHLERLEQSLRLARIDSHDDKAATILANIARNQIVEGMVYLQVSRGSAPRNHSFYGAKLTPSVVVYSTPFLTHPCAHQFETGVHAITHEDFRSRHCNIKSVNLLANCLAISHANHLEAQEAVLIRDSIVCECSSANIFLVKDNQIITPQLTSAILPGVTRKFLLTAFKNSGYNVVERTVHESELFTADELFMSSTIKEAMAITKLNQKIVGSGKVGPIARHAQALIASHACNNRS